MRPFNSLLLISALLVPSPLQAGLHYSGESLASLPSQWRGFLLDQRSLRMIAVQQPADTGESTLRGQYQAERRRLEKEGQNRPLTAEESADLGAILIRLGESGRAVEVLQGADLKYPKTFKIKSNLATAWQYRGDLTKAAAFLREAVELAPGKFQKAEQLHLQLVQIRARRSSPPQELDPFFDLQWIGPDGKYQAGALAETERKRLPLDAVANLQLLALWLPDDPLLLWQLAELANAHGDVITSAAILDGCVTEFGLRSPVLREHRQIVRAAVEAQSRNRRNKEAHDSSHALLFQPRSLRPLLSKLDKNGLPPINGTGTNPLPWPVLTETVIEKPFKPQFSRYLQDLAGKEVEITGFMQPLGEESDCAAFLLIEFPIGCWYCEMPGLTAMVRIEMPGDSTQPFVRNRLRVTGELVLNPKDPERFLYTIKAKKVME